MINFWESSVWGFMIIISVLLVTIVLANILKRTIPFLKNSLIPTSVLAGAIILIISIAYTLIVENVGNLSETMPKNLFELSFFGNYGTATNDEGASVPITGLNVLEVITYHSLALGFIATAFKPDSAKLTKKRSIEVFDTGVTTVSTYLLQGTLGLLVTILFPVLVGGFKAAGLILPFGYGQGTGQALNYGKIYEGLGFSNGSSFGLTIAALGFLSASIGGVIHLNLVRKRQNKKATCIDDEDEEIPMESVQAKGDSPMEGSVDKFSIQVGVVLFTYALAYGAMLLIGSLLSGMKATIY